MPSIKYIQDKNEEVFYPVTHERGVCDSDGVRLSTKLTQNNAVVTNLGNILSSVSSQVNTMSSRTSIVAWDGASEPVVANIPAGVTVEYDGNEYTGTLTASPSTVDKEYLVGEEGSDTKTRYITSASGSTYTWVDYGTTDIDLSDYERKDDNVWLTEDEFAALAVKDPTKTYNVYEEVAEI